MNGTAWITNEIATSYERNFMLLEAARKEYAQGVSDFMTNLHRALSMSANGSAECEGVEAVSMIYGSEFNTTISVGLSVTGESPHPLTPSGIAITVKAAAPFGGTPGHLRVATIVSVNGQAHRWNMDNLRPQVCDWALHANSKSVIPAADELMAFEVSLEGDGMSRAADAIQHLRSLLTPLALEIVEDQQFTGSMKQTLLDCAHSLSRKPPATDGEIEKKTDWWQGMHFIQFNSPPAPGFWVGYLVQNGTLMYGHNRASNLPSSLEDEYFTRVGAKPPKKHGNLPAGVLLTSDDLRTRSPEEIADRVVLAFHHFHQLITELRADGASQSNPESP